MSNIFMEALKDTTDVGLTENGAVTKTTTRSAILDMFALCGSYRNRSDEDCILAFQRALAEDEHLAMKCLFYLRDCRGGGQGERRFFRVCFHWLCDHNKAAAARNLNNIPEYGRWDDLIYSCVGTTLEDDAFDIIKHQLALDLECKTPSLLAKWLPSENASSEETKKMGGIVRRSLGMSHKEYRQMLSVLRTTINIVEKLMSEDRWGEIEFDKIPSKAGLIYEEAFARRDIIAKKYKTFIKDKSTKVNAGTLYPYEVVNKAIKILKKDYSLSTSDDINRLAINKYWDNLTDYFNEAVFNGIAVVDTSASMRFGSAPRPIDVAISLGMYCAERNRGPFAGHYISFSSIPQLVPVEGVDFCDKVRRIYQTNICENTNLEAVFDLILNNAINYNMSQDDLPQNIIIISDMQIDQGTTAHREWGETEMEAIHKKFESHGYRTPHLIYWNVDARRDTILDRGVNISYISGASPIIFEQILSEKKGYELMMDKLSSSRYAPVG